MSTGRGGRLARHLPIEAHREYGAALRTLAGELVRLSCIGDRPTARVAGAARERVSRLRSLLDSALYREHAGATLTVYYGAVPDADVVPVLDLPGHRSLGTKLRQACATVEALWDAVLGAYGATSREFRATDFVRVALRRVLLALDRHLVASYPDAPGVYAVYFGRPTEGEL